MVFNIESKAQNPLLAKLMLMLKIKAYQENKQPQKFLTLFVIQQYLMKAVIPMEQRV